MTRSSFLSASKLFLKLSKLTRFLLAAGAVASAAAMTVALQTGVINGNPPSMTAHFDVPVPETATTFKITCYDHDGWWNPDDVLFKDDGQMLQLSLNDLAH